MNSRVLTAGWPFAGLLTLGTTRGDEVTGSAQRSGIIARDDGGSGILVYAADETYVSVELDHGTRVFGVDGYPISLGDLYAGDVVEVNQEQHQGRWVTLEIRVRRRSSERPVPG